MRVLYREGGEENNRITFSPTHHPYNLAAFFDINSCSFSVDYVYFPQLEKIDRSLTAIGER